MSKKNLDQENIISFPKKNIRKSKTLELRGTFTDDYKDFAKFIIQSLISEREDVNLKKGKAASTKSIFNEIISDDGSWVSLRLAPISYDNFRKWIKDDGPRLSDDKFIWIDKYIRECEARGTISDLKKSYKSNFMYHQNRLMSVCLSPAKIGKIDNEILSYVGEKKYFFMFDNEKTIMTYIRFENFNTRSAVCSIVQYKSNVKYGGKNLVELDSLKRFYESGRISEVDFSGVMHANYFAVYQGFLKEGDYNKSLFLLYEDGSSIKELSASKVYYLSTISLLTVYDDGITKAYFDCDRKENVIIPFDHNRGYLKNISIQYLQEIFGRFDGGFYL